MFRCSFDQNPLYQGSGHCRHANRNSTPEQVAFAVQSGGATTDATWVKVSTSADFPKVFNYFSGYDLFNNVRQQAVSAMDDPDCLCAYVSVGAVDGNIVDATVWISSPRSKTLLYLSAKP